MIPIQSGRIMVAQDVRSIMLSEHGYQSAAPGHGIAVKG
jgi:hypothetical protein